MLSVFFGLRAEGQSTLPACCRRGGAHHCLHGSAGPDGAPALSAVPCSRFPSVAKAVRASDRGAPDVQARSCDASDVGSAAHAGDRGVTADEACMAHSKRGPPSRMV